MRIEEKRDATTFTGAPDPQLYAQAEERALADAIDVAKRDASTAVVREDFAAAMRAMAQLRPHVDAFFAKVTVNGQDAGGAWYFEPSSVSDEALEAHYRTSQYWPAHAQIHLNLPVDGLSAGTGLAYSDSLTLSFSTGAANSNVALFSMLTVAGSGFIGRYLYAHIHHGGPPPSSIRRPLLLSKIGIAANSYDANNESRA